MALENQNGFDHSGDLNRSKKQNGYVARCEQHNLSSEVSKASINKSTVNQGGDEKIVENPDPGRVHD